MVAIQLSAQKICKTLTFKSLSIIKLYSSTAFLLFATAYFNVWWKTFRISRFMFIISPNLQLLLWTGVNNWWNIQCLSTISMIHAVLGFPLCLSPTCFVHSTVYRACHFSRFSSDLSSCCRGAVVNSCFCTIMLRWLMYPCIFYLKMAF